MELFFKTLKQNLKVKKFLGTTENAVKAQIAYLLLQFLELSLESQISIPDAKAVVGVMLLMKLSVSKLLGDLPRIKRHPPPDQRQFDF